MHVYPSLFSKQTTTKGQKQQQHPLIKGQRFEPSLEGDNKDLYL
jgi:hypothetical protein